MSRFKYDGLFSVCFLFNDLNGKRTLNIRYSDLLVFVCLFTRSRLPHRPFVVKGSQAKVEACVLNLSVPAAGRVTRAVHGDHETSLTHFRSHLTMGRVCVVKCVTNFL